MDINVSEMYAASIFRVELSRDMMWKGGTSQAKKHRKGQSDPHVVEGMSCPVRIKECE
jgi:hypothetical protein